MSVVITNVSRHNDPDGPNSYIVRINNDPIIASFEHVRKDGLAECLRRAAEAVERAEGKR